MSRPASSTRYAAAMLAMTELGRKHYRSGLPITAFPPREERTGLAKILSDRARAAYERGWRDAKVEATIEMDAALERLKCEADYLVNLPLKERRTALELLRISAK